MMKMMLVVQALFIVELKPAFLYPNGITNYYINLFGNRELWCVQGSGHESWINEQNEYLIFIT